MIALLFSLVACDLEQAQGERLGVAYYNAHNGAIAAAAAVVDADGKILAAYLDDVFLVDLNQGYEGLPAVDSNRVTDYLANPAYTLASKKYKVNSDIYGAAMAARGSTVLPADNLTKIQEFAVGKTVADLEAIMAKSSADAKEEIQAASGATFTDNQRYLNTIVLAAKNAQKTYNSFDAKNPVLKQAYYNTHGAPGLAYVVLQGDKIVASYLDEFYFFDSNTTDVVFQMDAAKSIPAFKANKGLSSKKTNGAKYGITLKGGIYVDQIAAIESFINGKTVAELKQAVEKLSAEGAVVADVVAGATIRDTKDYIKAAIIAADPAQAAGDAKAQPVKQVGMTKLGIGYVPVDKSKSATADAPASIAIDSTIAAVGFDKDGKVVKVSLDVIQPKIAFDKDLKITTELGSAVQTKTEIGDAYGMINASTIGKNWHEQAAALEKWMIGKTVDQIKAMKVYQRDATHPAVPEEADLTSSVTITVQDYIEAVAKAYESAVEVPMGGTSVGLGIDTIISDKSKSLDATAKVNPMGQIDATIAATVFNSKGAVVATLIDVAQQKVSFDEKGQITNTLLDTKLQLGAAYGMKVASSIGLEWNEQIAGFGKKIAGKTAKEVSDLKLNEAGKAADADILATITVGLQGYMDAVAESFANAK